MKPIKEMSFREQIGAAAKYGAYSNGFRTWGFRALSTDGEPVTLTPEAFETFIDGLSSRPVRELARFLTEKQPMEEVFGDWSELDVLKLRACLALRLDGSRRLSEAAKNLALTRTYRREQAYGVAASPYRDGSPGQRLSRGERQSLYESIAEAVEVRLSPRYAKDAAVTHDAHERPVESDQDDDFRIVHAYNLYTFPATANDKWQISKSVTVRALRDNVLEYRNTAETAFKGTGAPELELLSGQGAHFERLAPQTRANVAGFEYQVVIPFSTPMREGEERSFSWIIRSAVDEEFWAPGARIHAVGFRPSRGLERARVALQFAPGAAPDNVCVVTNARKEDMAVYDPDGETRDVVDDYVEMTWEHPRIARYCNLVWQ